MIYLELSEFQCFRYHRVEFPDTGIVLLDGPTGVGKSTLLESISFVLYNDTLESCYPETIDNPKTWVRLTLPGYRIEILRSKNPNNIQVTSDGIYYSGLEAENQIQNRFGLLSGWLSSAYIRQERRCDFLTMSGADKLDFLQQMFMPDPEIYQRRLETVARLSTEVTNRIQECQYSRSIVEQMYHQLAIQIPPGESIWTVARYTEAIQSQPEIRLADLYQLQLKVSSQLTDVKSQNKRHETISHQIQNAIHELSLLDDPTEKIQMEEQRRSMFEQQLTLLTQLQKKTQLLLQKSSLEQKLNKLPNLGPSQWTLGELTLFEKIQSGRSRETIEKELQLAEDTLQYLEYLRKRREQDQYRSRLSALDTLQQQWKSIRDQLNTISLPDNPNQEIVRLKQQANQIREYLVVQGKRKIIQDQIDKLPPESKLEYTLAQLKEWEPLIRGLSVDQLNTQLNRLNQAITYLQLSERHQQRATIQTAYDQLHIQLQDAPVQSVQDRIDILTKRLVQYELEKTILNCPECGSSVVLRDQALHKKTIDRDQPIDTLRTEQTQLIQQEKRYQFRLTHETRYFDLRGQLDSFGELPPCPESIPEYRTWNLEKLFTERSKVTSQIEKRTAVPEINLLAEREKISTENRRAQLQRDLSALSSETVDGDLDTIQKSLLVLETNVQRCQSLSRQLPSPDTERNTSNEWKSLQELLIELPEQTAPSSDTDSQARTKIAKCRHELTDLDSVPPSLDIDQEKKRIQSIADRKRCQQEIEDLVRQLDSLDQVNSSSYLEETDEARLQTEIRTCTQNIQKYLRIQDQRRTLQGKIQTLEEQLPSRQPTEDLDQRLGEIAQNIQACQLLIQQIAYQKQLFQLQSYTEKYNQFVQAEVQLTQRLGLLTKIRGTIFTGEYVILDTILDNINTLLEPILENMFDEQISVKLRSLRKLKTSEKVKPEINLEIVHGKRQINKLNKLSGGQRSLISMALMMSFAKMGNYPFLMLDECISCLHVNYREKIIKLLRNPDIGLREKLVIVVNHDSNEGAYNETIRLHPSDLNLV